MNLKFPHNFLFGASTASHQVEGNGNNDWTVWEKEHAERLVEEAKKKEWPPYILQLYPNPLQVENYISGRACDHYNRFEEDFDIAKSLGHNAHRMSVSWSKVEPEEGKFDERELQHYYQVAHALRQRGIEPLVTLWHWPLPLWLRDKGGWENPKTAEYFARYAEKVVKALDQHISYWITLNEPEVYCMNGYVRGNWPPQIKSWFRAIRTYKNLARGHRKAYKIIKAINADAHVGFAVNNTHFKSHGGPVNYVIKRFADRYWNESMYRMTKGDFDFIGLNFYFHSGIDWGFNKNQNKVLSDVGWEIDPKGIYSVLRRLRKWGRPIIITENGVADARDIYRATYIENSLYWVERAINDGAAVQGYLHWSLLDNFEWSKGYWPRFGLVEIDYRTLERKIRPSAWRYKEIIEGSK